VPGGAFEDLAAAFDFKLAFEDIERLIFPMMDVFRCSVTKAAQYPQ